MRKNWETKKLGDVCIVERGGSPRPIDKFITTSEDGINWIKIGDATNGSKYITSTKEKIIPEGVKKSRVVYKGDFILSNSMSFGRPYILDIDGCIHDGWLVLRDRNNVFNKSYLYYYLSSPNIYREFKRLAVGGVVNNLNSDLVRSVKVVIPPLAEQERIVAELDCILGIIEKQKQQLKELDNLAKSIFYTTFGDPTSNNFGWKNRRLGEMVNSNMIGLTRSGSEQDASYKYLYFKMNNIGNEGGVDWSKTTRVNACAQEVEKYTLKEGDFLFNTRNSFELVGKTCVYPHIDGEICLFNNNIMRIDFKKEINATYMAYLFQDKYTKNQLDRIKKGTTSVWAIYYKDLEKIDILVPDIALQEEFAFKVAAIEKQKEIIKQSIEEAETLFNSRMDYYFN